ncbi:amino acid ABC transporter permease [Nocardioides sp. HDW12B]|uniref:amino acid ABC transporter permease n=1 Tax=Nocardioides sp. HDW12B TaxID=2714939 RepID=UPI00140B17A4|nr:amino acid ABC transporter permease [Nocardioides sp. HDW12B]QIK67810.1 amino acid ABC transporter permease [Nocardioides sp. HDW12B]
MTVSEWRPSELQRERLEVRRRQRLRSVLLASASAVVVLGGLVALVVTSPGWPTVQATFFDLEAAKDALPAVLEGFWLNIRLFLLAEPLILVVGLLVAAARVSRSPLLFPVRLLAVAYTDVFRGIPTILLVYLVCFGVPALGLQGVTTSLFWLALVALVLSYGAYVAEVFRAGIESIHPSQVASATALGLSSGQTLRHVVVPQATRRVLPPLLNDFVSLQKDTALVVGVGLFDALGTASDTANYTFNFTPYVVAAALFILLTIPLARYTDHVGRRLMERERAGAR